jgi:hypothetical protein
MNTTTSNRSVSVLVPATFALIQLVASACKPAAPATVVEASTVQGYAEVSAGTVTAAGQTQAWKVTLRDGHRYSLAVREWGCVQHEGCGAPTELIGNYAVAPTPSTHSHRGMDRIDVVGKGGVFFLKVKPTETMRYEVQLHDFSCDWAGECPNDVPVVVGDTEIDPDGWREVLATVTTFAPGSIKSPFLRLQEVPRAREIKIESGCGTVTYVVASTAGSSIRGPLKRISWTPSVWSSNVPGKVLDLAEVQIELGAAPRGECRIRVLVKE